MLLVLLFGYLTHRLLMTYTALSLSPGVGAVLGPGGCFPSSLGALTSLSLSDDITSFWMIDSSSLLDHFHLMEIIYFNAVNETCKCLS